MSGESRSTVQRSRKPPSRINDIEVDSLVVEYGLRQHVWEDEDDRSLSQWYATLSATDDNGEIVTKIGDAAIAVLDYISTGNPFEVLDCQTADLGQVGGVLFQDGELTEKLDQKLEVLGSSVLIVDRVEIEPDWRGHSLGLLFAGLAIEKLGLGCRFAALLPGPLERRNLAGKVVDQISDEEYGLAVKKLGSYWKKLGFVHFRENIWVLDLNLITLSKKMKNLRRNLGLHP